MRSRNSDSLNNGRTFLLRNNRRRVVNLDIRNKTVAALGNGLDVFRVARLVFENPSDLRYVLSQIVLFYELVPPDHPQKIFFAQNRPVVFDQSEESVERLRRQH